MTREVLKNDLDLKSIKRRSFFILVLLLSGFSVLAARAYVLQSESDNKISHIAENQYYKITTEVPSRGNIYDVNGKELATSLPTYSLVAYPHLSKKPADDAKKLSRILDVPYNIILKKLASDKKFAWIKRGLTQKEEELTRRLKEENNWIDWVREGKRFYPHREMASQVLGAVGYDNKALGGIELHYDKYLKGNNDRSVSYQDARGFIYQTAEAAIDDGKISHIRLTLDRNIQHAAEVELAKGCEKHKAKSGMAIVMDPHTGAILAMANFLPFNPNSYSEYPVSYWKNQAVLDAFEPGSTFKVILAAAALEYDAVKPKELFDCHNGELTITGRHTIHDHDKYGKLNLGEIIKVSSNIGAYRIGQRIGKKSFHEIIKKFGFGKKTGIDFPGEADGSVGRFEKWGKLDEATVSFGQGVSATSIQMANAFATIANGGEVVRPYLVDRILDENGNVIKRSSPKTVGRAIKKETAEKLTEILRGVVSDGGTGYKAKIPGYSVAGKTGTAQKIDEETRTYSESKYAASFAGFLPASDPKVVIFVIVDEPKGNIYASEVAVPIFKEIAEAAIYYLTIPPDIDGAT